MRVSPLLLVVIVASAALSVAADITDEKVVPSTMCGRFFYVEIEVDGKEPGSRVTLNALFDTGGAQLSIDPGTVKRLWGLKVSAPGVAAVLNGSPNGRSMAYTGYEKGIEHASIYLLDLYKDTTALTRSHRQS